MKFNTSLLLLWMLSGLAVSVTAAPKITCPAPEYSFGTVGEGEAIERRFLLQNAGDEDLILHQIIPSCSSCTVINVATNRLAPGEALSLPVRLVLGGLSGAVSKTITVESNDPVTPKLELVIKGLVTSEIILRPQVVVFGLIEEGTSVSREVSIAAGMGQELEIQSADTQKRFFQTELLEKESGEGYLVRLTYNGHAITDPQVVTEGRITDTLVMQTNSSRQPVLKVGIQASIQVALRAFPSEFKFPAHSKTAMASLALRSPAGKPFKVLEAAWPQPDVTSEIIGPNAMGMRILFRGIKIEDSLNGQFVTVQTDMPGFEKFQIPITITHPPSCVVCNTKAKANPPPESKPPVSEP